MQLMLALLLLLLLSSSPLQPSVAASSSSSGGGGGAGAGVNAVLPTWTAGGGEAINTSSYYRDHLRSPSSLAAEEAEWKKDNDEDDEEGESESDEDEGKDSGAGRSQRSSGSGSGTKRRGARPRKRSPHGLRQTKKYGVDWVEDHEADNCMCCGKAFSRLLLRWRHHCRVCGRVVCDSCSQDRVSLVWLAGWLGGWLVGLDGSLACPLARPPAIYASTHPRFSSSALCIDFHRPKPPLPLVSCPRPLRRLSPQPPHLTQLLLVFVYRRTFGRKSDAAHAV